MRRTTLNKLISFACISAVLVKCSDASPNGIAGGCSSSGLASSLTVIIESHEILHQTFTCLNGSFFSDTPSEPRSTDSAHLGSRTSLASRDQILCEFPQFMTECQCGATFNCQCFQGDVAPSVFDCLNLVNSVTSANEGSQTFTVQPNQLEVFTLRSCSLSFVNLQNAVVDYCWDNLNFIGVEAWDRCVSDESDRVVGATCIPGNGQYRVSLGPVVST